MTRSKAKVWWRRWPWRGKYGGGEDGGNTAVGKVGLTRPSPPPNAAAGRAALPHRPVSRPAACFRRGGRRAASCASQPRHPLPLRTPLPSRASPTAPLLSLGRLVAVHEGREEEEEA